MPTTFSLMVLLAVVFVAYANGANDNFKGVATLFGSGTTKYRRALTWGTATTFAGSVAAMLMSDKLVKTFSGAGLVPEALVGTPTFVTAVTFGAAATVVLATFLSFPVSTTHALTGSLLGAGFVMGGDIHLGVLGPKFFLPLLVSPVLAIVLIGIIYPVLRHGRTHLGVTRNSCVCVEGQWVPVPQLSPSAFALPVLAVPKVTTCEERYQGVVFSVDAQQALNSAHYLSAGAVSFARGLNDTPKICALLIASQALGLRSGLTLVGLAMAAGAVLSGRRVAETLAKKITAMNHGQGFAANLVTAGLVLGASRFGIPVSTTHVSCGALFGLGMVTRQVRWKVMAGIVLAWVVTLPVAVLASATAAWVLR